MQPKHFSDLFLKEINRRLFEENFPRMKRCILELELADIWNRPNENSNSMGNLVLHMDGNLRQWVVATFEQRPDTREREKEFNQRDSIPKKDLLLIIEELREAVQTAIGKVQQEHLVRTYTVQGFEETGIGILIHAVEHFSYHVGQMTYFVKSRKDMDMGYYAGIELG